MEQTNIPEKSVDGAGEPCTPQHFLAQSDLEYKLRRFNDTDIPYPENMLIQEIFEEHVRRTPNAIAQICESTQSTYAELNERANQLAHELLTRGVKPDDRICFYADRGVDTVAALLGILKAGACYVPLDPTYPAERVTFMLADCSPVVVISQNSLAARLPADQQVLILDDCLPKSTDNPVISGLRSQNLACVLYTSGSTGRPKGVMVEHRSVLRLVINASYAQIGASDCVAQCASLSFDAATWEIWAPLLNGAKVLVVPHSVVLAPAALNSTLVEHSVSALFLTTALFNQYADALEGAFSGLRYLLTGGEAINPSVVRRVLTKPTALPHLVNLYGPTEATTFAVAFEIGRVPGGERSLPIGKPIGNTRIYILDSNRQPVPIAEKGEIYIGGPGVARGYLNQPALTAERFVANPFASDDSDKTLYRTGDMGCWQANGIVEFLGRDDFQVKVRGFRIELGEVEAALQSYSEVAEAVVIALDDKAGEKRLFAYVVCAEEAGRITLRQKLVPRLRHYLKESLPPYMMPAVIVLLDTLPLTANGKVDRGRLPIPKDRPDLDAPYMQPLTELEERITDLWSYVLEFDRIGIGDNFLELGGNSLLATKLSVMIFESFNVQIPALAVLEYPTVRLLAELIGRLSLDHLQSAAADQFEFEEGLI